MGFLDSIITGVIGTGQQVMQNGYNSDEAEKNREFQSYEAQLNRIYNANQAAIQRRWSSQEAEQARAWQEEMNAKYNSISGKIAQADAAGVNPMFAVTGNAVSPASASSSAPSGASAGSVGVPSGSAATNGMLNILGAILDAKKVESEIKVNESVVSRNLSESQNLDKQTSWIDKMSSAELDHLVSSSAELQSRLRVNDSTANKLSAEFNKLVQETARISQITSLEKRKLEADALYSEWLNNNKEWMYGVQLGLDVVGQVNSIAQTIIQGKTGINLSDRPIVVPKDSQVYLPKDIVR